MVGDCSCVLEVHIGDGDGLGDAEVVLVGEVDAGLTLVDVAVDDGLVVEEVAEGGLGLGDGVLDGVVDGDVP